MGLGGRKEKQRIPNDPRNLSWADDAARFGSSYLSKFGWDASKGLGATGDGRTSHIKISQKLDMMGIGAAHMKDPNGIAWKQNKDFENLLKRLNENSGAAGVMIESESTVEVEVMEEAVVVVETKDEGTDQHRENKERSKRDKKRKREEDSERPKKKTRQKDARPKPEDEEPSPAPAPTPRPPPRFRAHRARAIAAKDISSKSSAHIFEILGVAPTPATSQSASGSATPAEGKSEVEKITTSAKSVADYFKEKLLAKSSKLATPAAWSASPGLSSQQVNYHDEQPLGGLGFSKLRVAIQKPNKVEEEPVGMGLSKSSSLMSSTFLPAKSAITFATEALLSIPEAISVPKEDAETPSREERREEKRRRKAEKEKKAGAEREDKKAKGNQKDKKRGG